MNGLSLIIPSYQCLQSLSRCLEQIHKVDKPEAFEIIVVDSSPSGLPKELKSRFTEIHFIESSKRLFAAQARNLGAEKAAFDRLAFLDADLLISAGWLTTAAGLPLKGKTWSGPVLFERPERSWSYALHLIEFPEFLSLESKPLRFPPSGNLIISKSDFHGFNEDFKICEDLELGSRLSSLQFNYTKELSVTHMNRGFRLEEIYEKQKTSGYWRGFYDPRLAKEFVISRKKAYPVLKLFLGFVFCLLVFRRLYKASRKDFRLAALMPLKMLKLCCIWATAFKNGLQDSRP